MSGFYSWSRTAALNASSDVFTWAEGMAPSAVNDSARGMMASTAKWRDDTSGALTTAGTSTAYTIASYQGFDTLAHLDGMMIAFTPHTTNGAAVTINVDGLGAKPLRGVPGADLPAAVLIQGSPYVATYYNSSDEFILHCFYHLPETTPIGQLSPYLGTTAPNANFAFPFGQAFSRTIYSKLFALIGTTFGSGDGSTTFNGPDVRGRAFFALDNMGGAAANRITTAGSSIDGTSLGATGGAQSVSLTGAQTGPHIHANTATQVAHDHGVGGNIFRGNGIGTADGIYYQNVPNTAFVGNLVAQAPAITMNNASAGNGDAHQNMPPAFVCPVIMRII